MKTSSEEEREASLSRMNSAANSLDQNDIDDIITQVNQDSSVSRFQVWKFITNLCSCFTPMYKLPAKTIEESLLPPQQERHKGRKTLILDLDETLVHSSFKTTITSDLIITVDINGFDHAVYVLKRPGVAQFLEAVAEDFEVVVFTASLSKYANPLLDIIDPERYISDRLFRQHCTFFNGSYVKDLSLLGRDLNDIIIVDNSPMAYSFNPDNAVPITSWFDDKNDTELTEMIPLLKALSKEKSVPLTLRGLKERKLLLTHKNIMELNSDKNTQQQANVDHSNKSQHTTQDKNRSHFNSPMGVQAEKNQFNFE